MNILAWKREAVMQKAAFSSRKSRDQPKLHELMTNDLANLRSSKPIGKSE